MNYTRFFDPNKVQLIQVKNPLVKTGLRSGGYSLNPYIGCPHACMYCYVPAMRYGPSSDFGRWGTFLHVKQWDTVPPQIARNYVGEHVTLGSATDPYNPLEAHFQRTKSFLEEFQDSGIQLSIITKSDLILRDLDLLLKYDSPVIAFSINTLDEDFKNQMDAAPSIAKRLEALRCCKDAGLLTSVFISPVFPLLTDVFEIIEEVREHCDSIWIDALNLQQKNMGTVTGFISAEYSWAFPLYRKIYKEGDSSYWRELSESVKVYAKKNGMEYSNGKITSRSSPLGCPRIIDYLPRHFLKRQ